MVDFQVLEYTLFQPGLFLNYLAYPHRTAKYLEPLQTTFDFANTRAILLEGHDPVMTLTSVQDFAAVVVKAVEVDDAIEWPVVSGMVGWKGRFSDLVKVGERIRGTFPFDH